MPAVTSLESFRLEFECSSAAAPELPVPLLLRRFDAAERLDGSGRMPDIGAAHSGQVVSPVGERNVRVRKHLKCIRCPHPDTNVPTGAGRGVFPSEGGGMDHPVHATAKTDAAADDDLEMATN